MTSEKGSIWRKWDLHIHTPASFHWTGRRFKEMEAQDIESSIKSMIDKMNSIDVAAFGIMDYWTFEGYWLIKKYLADHTQITLNKRIFPGMELRIQAPVDFRLNIHVLFDDSLTEQQLADFKSRLMIPINMGTEFPISDESLIRFARTLDPSKAQKHGFAGEQLRDAKELLKLGSKTAVISRESLKNAMGVLPKGSVLIIMPYDTSDGLKDLKWEDHPLDDNYFMQSAHIFETRDEDNVDLFMCKETDKNRSFIENFKKTLGGKAKPCISGSDAHKIDDYGNFPSNRITWIKADVSFEGLKQIIYEPHHRVIINTNPPIEPIYKIEKIVFDFPDATRIENEEFCLRRKKEIYFSPNLTCLIGGRGTGKSMVLNLIHEKIHPGDNPFFRNHPVVNAVINDCVEIEGATNIEFLSQNEIEDFALDKEKFTDAVYNRLIKLDSEGKLEKCKAKLKDHLKALDEQFERYKDKSELEFTINQRKIELKRNSDIVDFSREAAYTTISSDLMTKTAQLEQLSSSKSRLSKLIVGLQNLLKEFTSDAQGADNPYRIFINTSISAIQDLIKTYLSPNYFATADAHQRRLTEETKGLRERLNNYLSLKGLTQENMSDISKANELRSMLQGQIDILQNRHKVLIDEIAEFHIDVTVKSEYEKEFSEQLKPITERLKNLSTQVKTIGLEYEFDRDSAKEEFLRIVVDKLPSAEKSVKREDYVREILFLVEPDNPGEHDSFVNTISESKTNPKTTLALVDYFRDSNNFESYKVLGQKFFLNADKYKSIKVYYDGRPIANTSFGQRCTAAIVLLLLIGNTPLVIDEPEAHLDSSLIATYLVDLLKTQKRSRQVIFATHNANIVVNGDSELIQILSMDSDKLTRIIPTTIENSNHRQELVSLEGGELAFKRREEKYEI